MMLSTFNVMQNEMVTKVELTHLTWDDVRQKIQKINPKLAAAIDEISPGKRFKLIQADYRFGDYILKNGRFHLPTSHGNSIPLEKCNNAALIKQLNFNRSLPLALVLQHNAEIFADHPVFDVSHQMWHPGNIGALWVTLSKDFTSTQANHLWSVVAGSRTIAMLPKISDAIHHKRLVKHFQTDIPLPKELKDQSTTLTKVIQLAPECAQWKTSVLYFTDSWIRQKDNKKWFPLWKFLNETATQNSQTLRDQVLFEYVLSCAIISKNLKPNPYVIDVIRQLFAAALGLYPAFMIANDNLTMPTSTLQKIYTDVYELKYAPTLAHMGHFDITQRHNQCHYLSLAQPNLVQFSPKSKRTSSKLEDLQEIQHVMNRLKDYLLKDELGLRHSIIYEWAEKVRYDYFHTGPFERESEHIFHTSEMPKGDPVLAEHLADYPTLPFCENSPFIRGCIRISKK